MAEWNHVQGKQKKDIRLYALSTCGHCKTTKDFLTAAKLSFDYIYVDLLSEDELEKVYSEMKRYNPRGSFPTLLIDKKDVIVGSKLEEIKEALELND